MQADPVKFLLKKSMNPLKLGTGERKYMVFMPIFIQCCKHHFYDKLNYLYFFSLIDIDSFFVEMPGYENYVHKMYTIFLLKTTSAANKVIYMLCKSVTHVVSILQFAAEKRGQEIFVTKGEWKWICGLWNNLLHSKLFILCQALT